MAGVVYERGQHIGYSDPDAGDGGRASGGQSFSEPLVFESKAALDRFKAGQFGFAAGASAVVLKSGVATTPTLLMAWPWSCNPLKSWWKLPLVGSSSRIRPSEPRRAQRRTSFRATPASGPRLRPLTPSEPWRDHGASNMAVRGLRHGPETAT